MTEVKNILYQFTLNPTPQTAACAKEAIQAELVALKTARIYGLVIATVSFMSLLASIYVPKEDNNSKLLPIVTAISYLVFSVSIFTFCFSFPAQWFNGRWLKKLETFETL